MNVHEVSFLRQVGWLGINRSLANRQTASNLTP